MDPSYTALILYDQLAISAEAREMERSHWKEEPLRKEEQSTTGKTKVERRTLRWVQRWSRVSVGIQRRQEARVNRNHRGVKKSYGNEKSWNQCKHYIYITCKNYIYKLHGDTYRVVKHSFRSHGLLKKNANSESPLMRRHDANYWAGNKRH